MLGRNQWAEGERKNGGWGLRVYYGGLRRPFKGGEVGVEESYKNGPCELGKVISLIGWAWVW